MPRRCALGCTWNNGVFHCFPNPDKFPERYKAWVQIVSGKTDSAVDYKKKRICDRHFIDDHRNRYNRLNALAVPSLFLPENFDNIQEPTPTCDQYMSPSTTTIQTAQQLEVSNNEQSTSDYSLQTPCASTSVTSKLLLDKPLGSIMEDSFLGEPLKLSCNPLLDHNYSQLTKKTHKVKYLKSTAVTPSKYRDYQNTITNLRRQIYRYRKRECVFKSRLKNAEKLLNKPNFQKIIQNMPSAAKIFTGMQYYQALKKGRGRRFTIDEKILSLSLYKRSPKCYGLLSKYFILPSIKSVKRLLSKIKLSPGINKIVFDKLKITVRQMDCEDKLCTLIFDEMSIMPQVHYDAVNDKLKGFACHDAKKIANHALVFMIKGIKKNYKQPVAYYFTNGINRYELKTILKEVIFHVQSTGSMSIKPLES